jgi:mono/diheme cytochrome c family protein
MSKTLAFAIVYLACIAVMATSKTLMAADLGAARDNFRSQCSKCHGESGRGDGPAGVSLPVRPRNLADCSRMSKESDERIFRVIKSGGASVGMSQEMPPWQDAFDDNEIRDLVAYVRQYCNPQRANR